jgi:hypothetical protein
MLMRTTALAMIRHALTFCGGLVVARGYIDSGSAAEITGAVMTLIGVAWSIAEKRRLFG